MDNRTGSAASERFRSFWTFCNTSQIIRLNRAVALAEIQGPAAALNEISQLNESQLRDYAPYQAVRADLLRRTGDLAAAAEAYQKAIDLVSTSAERNWLARQKSRLLQ